MSRLGCASVEYYGVLTINRTSTPATKQAVSKMHLGRRKQTRTKIVQYQNVKRNGSSETPDMGYHPISIAPKGHHERINALILYVDPKQKLQQL